MLSSCLGLAMVYAHSSVSPKMFTCVLLPTEDGRLTSSPGPVVINKEANTDNTEEQRLIRQLQSATEERNELRDLLTYVTERYRNNRYALLQTALCHSWTCNVTSIVFY